MGTPYISEIKLIPWNYAPQGWAFCNGQLLPINQNQALFSLLGTAFGGDGRTTFGLPNLQGRVAIHTGNGFNLGQAGGENVHSLTIPEMPTHLHFVNVDNTTAATSNTGTPGNTVILGQSLGVPSSGSNFNASMYGPPSPQNTLSPNTFGNTGNNTPHPNQQPYLVLNYMIALQGVYPSRN